MPGCFSLPCFGPSPKKKPPRPKKKNKKPPTPQKKPLPTAPSPEPTTRNILDEGIIIFARQQQQQQQQQQRPTNRVPYGQLPGFQSHIPFRRVEYHGPNPRARTRPAHRQQGRPISTSNNARMMAKTVGNPNEAVLRAEGIEIRDFAVEAEQQKREEQRRELERIQREMEENCVAVWDFAYADGVGAGEGQGEGGVEVGVGGDAEGGAEVKTETEEEEGLWEDWFGSQEEPVDGSLEVKVGVSQEGCQRLGT